MQRYLQNDEGKLRVFRSRTGGNQWGPLGKRTAGPRLLCECVVGCHARFCPWRRKRWLKEREKRAANRFGPV